ncbi:MAG: rhodanese-like domain-containing protein [Hyphomicrobiaceae bacterium]
MPFASGLSGVMSRSMAPYSRFVRRQEVPAWAMLENHIMVCRFKRIAQSYCLAGLSAAILALVTWGHAAAETALAPLPPDFPLMPFVPVPTLSAADLAHRLEGSDKVVLFDVREAPEYAVSRIAGATRVAPAADPREFLTSAAGTVRGAIVVFYCTTGTRSTDSTERVYEGLMALGAKEVYVLAGGIFSWHNENSPLADADGATEYVHPLMEELKQHLKRPHLAKDSPNNNRIEILRDATE